MCWVTLTPSKGKKKGYRPTSDSSCVEDIVRVHHNPASPRLTNVRIRAPSLDVEVDEKHTHAHLYPHLQHHHRHPHLHPLHMHPVHGEHHLGMSFGLGPHHHHHHHRGSIDMSEISDFKLRGHGRKRSTSSPCPPPPPSTCPPASPKPAPAAPSSSLSSSSPPPPPPRDTSPLLPPSIPSLPREPIYHTQVIQPPSSRSAAVRETTRIALRTSTQQNMSADRRPRQNLRRVAGYQVLGRQVPWDWDCVSSTVGSSTAANAGGARGKWVRRKSGAGNGLKYPPFGDAEKWM